MPLPTSNPTTNDRAFDALFTFRAPAAMLLAVHRIARRDGGTYSSVIRAFVRDGVAADARANNVDVEAAK